MKKILTLTLITLIVGNVFSQDENELKNFRFGLKITPSVNWYKPDGKIMEKNGARVKFGGGISMEFRLAKVASLLTGLEINTDGGKIKYKNDDTSTVNGNNVSYVYNVVDDKIENYTVGVSMVNYGTASSIDHKYYQLNERQFKATYITIPLVLKLKTKEIGTLTYFGQFGVNSCIRWKAKANDNLTVMGSTVIEEKSGVEITKDFSVYTAALTFGAGAELNLSGSTSLLFGLNYNLGFTNVVKKNSEYLIKTTYGASNFAPMPQVLKSNAINLTIGVLF